VKSYLLSAVLLAVCCSGGSAATNDPAPAVNPDGVAKLIDPVFASGMKKENNIPGAVFVLVKDAKVIFAKGYGVADVNSGRRIDPETTIFPIASVTKMFTATGVMQLADSGRLDLHADVNRYLTSLRVPDTYPQPITTAHLLTHTSGPLSNSRERRCSLVTSLE
jgi:CubicO group peptidase (beta-lactamase class C family)